MTKNNKKMTQNNSRRPKMTKNDAKKQSVTDGPTDRRTDRPTDQPTDGAGFRVACTRLKTFNGSHKYNQTCTQKRTEIKKKKEREISDRLVFTFL